MVNVALIQKKVLNAGPTVTPQRGEYSLLFGRAGEAFQQELYDIFNSTPLYCTHIIQRGWKKSHDKSPTYDVAPPSSLPPSLT